MVPGLLPGDEIHSDYDYGVERGGYEEIDESGNRCPGAVQLNYASFFL